MGRVYRNEAVDATHLAMFHQFEGIWIDKGLTFAHLKGTLAFIVKELTETVPSDLSPNSIRTQSPRLVWICSVASVKEKVCGMSWCRMGDYSWSVWFILVTDTFGFDQLGFSGIASGLGTTRMAGQR